MFRALITLMSVSASLPLMPFIIGSSWFDPLVRISVLCFCACFTAYVFTASLVLNSSMCDSHRDIVSHYLVTQRSSYPLSGHDEFRSRIDNFLETGIAGLLYFFCMMFVTIFMRHIYEVTTVPYPVAHTWIWLIGLCVLWNNGRVYSGLLTVADDRDAILKRVVR